MDKRLEMFCELYDRSGRNVNTDALLKVSFFKDLGDVLNLLSYKQRVKFAYLCAKSVSHLNNEKTKEKAKKCLELIEKWLENPDSVSPDELRNAINIANAASAINSVNASSFNAAYAIAAAADAVAAVYTVVYSSVSYAADDYAAAYAAVYAAENKQEQEYKNIGFLVKVIRDGP